MKTGKGGHEDIDFDGCSPDDSWSFIIEKGKNDNLTFLRRH